MTLPAAIWQGLAQNLACRQRLGLSLVEGGPAQLNQLLALNTDCLALSPEQPGLEELSLALKDCRRCPLHQGRRQVVFGDGPADARLMLIGEAPGVQEDQQGLPFVGPAGQLLERMLGVVGLKRGQVYITNIVKCRPPGNRDPKTDETSACRPFLDRQRQLLSPAVVLALGRPATQNLLDSTAPLGQLRGRFHSFQGAVLLVTYHPAFLLRTPSMKAEAWRDLKLLRARLEELKLVEPAGSPWWKENAPS